MLWTKEVLIEHANVSYMLNILMVINSNKNRGHVQPLACFLQLCRRGGRGWGEHAPLRLLSPNPGDSDPQELPRACRGDVSDKET